jgi:integrase
MTGQGKPFTEAGFGNWFRGAADAAGLKGLASHGLRKAACRRLAEAGCSAHEIMSINGHTSLKEVQQYTRAADRAHLARAAFSRLEQHGNKNSRTRR